MAAVTAEDERSAGREARDLVLDSLRLVLARAGRLARRFFDERWIDAPVRPGQARRGVLRLRGAAVHPYVMLNCTAKRRDVLTLAHELGHGVHFALAARPGHLPAGHAADAGRDRLGVRRDDRLRPAARAAPTPESRLALLAGGDRGLDRDRVPPDRDEPLRGRRAHRPPRARASCRVDRFGELWARARSELLGDAVEITDGYRTWWSYIPHFIGTPGYVYAYAYGQLLALSVYRRYHEEGDGVRARATSSCSPPAGRCSPEELGRIVGIDLTDPGFWEAGLDLVEGQLRDAEQAARDAGADLTGRLLVAGRERLARDAPVRVAHDAGHDDREVAARHGLTRR